MTTTADTQTGSALEASDQEVWQMIDAERYRQASTLELIASENHVSRAVMEAVGSCLTNKYCEGYPGKRYYSGCDIYDDVESLAIERARKLFGCRFANVQPHSGANANLAVFFALLDPGDCYASVVLSDGGHLTHGSPVNLSGKWFRPIHYPLVYDESRDDYGHIDYDSVRRTYFRTWEGETGATNARTLELSLIDAAAVDAATRHAAAKPECCGEAS